MTAGGDHRDASELIMLLGGVSGWAEAREMIRRECAQWGTPGILIQYARQREGDWAAAVLPIGVVCPGYAVGYDQRWVPDWPDQMRCTRTQSAGKG